MKARATRTVVAGPQTATMRLDDGAADPESHAGAVGLGGKKRIEDLVCPLRWQTYAGIADGH